MQLVAAHRHLRIRNPVESAINNTATIATIVTDSVPEQSDETLTMTSGLSGDPSTDAYSCARFRDVASLCFG